MIIHYLDLLANDPTVVTLPEQYQYQCHAIRATDVY